jgi:hypothetical protein
MGVHDDRMAVDFVGRADRQDQRAAKTSALRKSVELDESIVPHHQPMIAIIHREALRHIAESSIKVSVQALKSRLALNDGCDEEGRQQRQRRRDAEVDQRLAIRIFERCGPGSPRPLCRCREVKRCVPGICFTVSASGIRRLAAEWFAGGFCSQPRPPGNKVEDGGYRG